MRAKHPMSLSEDLRHELATIDPRRECDRLAELSALFYSAGRLRLRGRGEVALHLDLASSAVARRAFALLRSFGIAAEIRTYRRRAFARATRYQLHVPAEGRAAQLLHEAGVVATTLAPLTRPPRRVIERSCCRAAYLRGALLGGGSLSGPRSPHLELRTASREGAELLAAIAAEEGAELTIQERDAHAVAYAKGTERISSVLLVAGARELVLALEEGSVLRATRSVANRLSNADHANLVRTSRAAQAQLEAARRLRRSGRLGELPAPLREAAELRLRYPALPLRELALRCDPKASKAAVYRRLRRLVELASP